MTKEQKKTINNDINVLIVEEKAKALSNFNKNIKSIPDFKEGILKLISVIRKVESGDLVGVADSNFLEVEDIEGIKEKIERVE